MYILRIRKKLLFGGKWSGEKRREEKLLEISGSGLRDCSSPQTPAPLHRSLIKDSLCPWAAPLSAEGPSRLCSEYLPVLLQVVSVQLSLRDRQNSGFQSTGPLAFPCLREINRDTSAWFTPPLFIPLHSPPKNQEMRRRRRRRDLQGVAEGWSQGHRMISEEHSGAPFPLWSSFSVVTEKWLPLGWLGSEGGEGSGGIIPFCLSVWTIFNLPDKMDLSKGILPLA